MENEEVKILDTPSKPGRKPKAIAVVPENKLTPDHWIAQAMEQGKFDLVEKFMDLRDREARARAKVAFAAAFAKFQEAVEVLEKTKSAKNYKFADLSNLQRALRKNLASNGFTVAWPTDEDGDKVTVTCVLSHVAGHYETNTMSGTPSDVIMNNSEATNAIQKKAALITYLRRYTYTGVLGISVGDQDTDGRVTERTGLRPPTDAQFKEIMVKLSSKKMTIADAEKLHSFDAGQMHSMSIAAK